MQSDSARAGATQDGQGRQHERHPVLLPSRASHSVQFYEDESFLAEAVGQFLTTGLIAGDPLIVIASEPHRQSLLERLSAASFDVHSVQRSGQLAVLDARETLERFMDDSMPHPERFRQTISRVIEGSTRQRSTGALRMYGEMVDLLWKDGNTDGAIRLEELWNELAKSYTFSLLCAYAMGNFYKPGDAERFQRVCDQHTHVLPTERYVVPDENARLLEVSRLQQRAVRLEAEIEHRRELERRLRQALAARRRAEEELRQRERDLQAALAERQSLLERERIARADAERADRAKSQFLAMMSHELRTPLNAIGGHVQLVQMGLHGPVTEAQSEALRRVERSQRHLLALINDLLNLTRIESGRVDYALEAVPLAPLLTEVVSTLEPLFASKALLWELQVSAGNDLVVHADREKVHQVLINLLTNALKFTPHGGRIGIEAMDLPAAGIVQVCVRDTGIGIPAAQLESVFEPFVQLGKHPSSHQDGVGLGLAISRDLARGMGGDLRAESAPDGGATFVLSLPREISISPAEALGGHPVTGPGELPLS